MTKWTLAFSKLARKDIEKLTAAGLRSNAEALLKDLKGDPFNTPPRYEKLILELQGAYSRRINLIHRLVYQVDDVNHIVRIIRMWTHFE